MPPETTTPREPKPGATMTQREFLAEFYQALSRPGVAWVRSASPRLRFTVPTVDPFTAEPLTVLCDPVGLIWWARTGTAAASRLLNGLSYAISLGMGSEQALAILMASDEPVGRLTGYEVDWRERLEGVLKRWEGEQRPPASGVIKGGENAYTS